jgi:hypothetical protein
MVFLQAHFEQYAGRYFAVSSAATAAFIIYKKWGLPAAFCFTATAVSGSYYLQSRISKLGPLPTWMTMLITFVSHFSTTAGLILGILATTFCWMGGEKPAKVESLQEKLEEHVAKQNVEWKGFEEQLKKMEKECTGELSPEKAKQVINEVSVLIVSFQKYVARFEKTVTQAEAGNKQMDEAVLKLQANNEEIARRVSEKQKQKEST